MAALLAWLGFAAHNVVEFSARTFATLDTVAPTVVTVALVVWWWRRPSGGAAVVALLTWTTLNAFGGAITVLPVDVRPFQPAQTVSHYVMHGIYFGAQLPLMTLLIRRLRARGQAPRST